MDAMASGIDSLRAQVCQQYFHSFTELSTAIITQHPTMTTPPANLTDLLNNSNTATSAISEFCRSGHSDYGTQSPSEILIDNLHFYLTGILGLIICLLGFIGNFMSVMVLTRGSNTRSSTYVYLTTLALSDSLVLVFAAFLNINDILNKEIQDLSKLFDFKNYQAYTFPYYNWLAGIFQTISIWITLGFTVDRYIMICHPFQGTKFCNRKRAIIVNIVVVVCGFLYNLPKFFEYETVTKGLPGGGTVAITTLTEFGRSPEYLQVVHLWCYLVFIFVVPCAMLMVLNGLLIRAVKNSRMLVNRMSMGQVSSPRHDTTVMLVAVVVVFLVCQLPALIAHTVWASNPQKFLNSGPESVRLNIFQEIANFLVLLNSAINILLYYMFSKKFRKQFSKTFCSHCMSAGKIIITGFRRLSVRSNTDTEISQLQDRNKGGIMSRLSSRRSSMQDKQLRENPTPRFPTLKEESSALLQSEEEKINGVSAGNNNKLSPDKQFNVVGNGKVRDHRELIDKSSEGEGLFDKSGVNEALFDQTAESVLMNNVERAV